MRVKIKNTQRSNLELLNIELRGYRRGAFGIWFAYNDRKTITGTSATLKGNDFQFGQFTLTNNLYGIGGNNNVLERKVFDSNAPSVPFSVPAPAALNPPANSGISGFGGYNNACVDFNIEFFHPHPGSPIFIEI